MTIAQGAEETVARLGAVSISTARKQLRHGKRSTERGTSGMAKEISYEDLQKANALIKTTPVKGKEYAEVPQRVKAFRSLFPTGTISTEVVMIENDLCVMHATVAVDGVILGEGTAYEREGSSYINKTSFIENCETSAVGRALGFAGFGSDASIASAEEVANAIEQQDILAAEENLAAKIKKLIEKTNTDTTAFLKAVNYKYHTNYQSVDELRGKSLEYAMKRIKEKDEEQQ